MVAKMLLAILACASVVVAQTGFQPLITHALYNADYAFNDVLQTARIHVVAQTTGFIGFGISPTGQMHQADIYMVGCNAAGEPYGYVSNI